MNSTKIKRAIYDALENYNCSVSFHKDAPETCAYFSVEIHEEWDWDWIEDDIERVCEEYDLWIDDDSDGDFDLCIKND